MGIWSNAFKMPVHPDLTAEEKAAVEMMAGRINRRSLGWTASLALESTRPVHNLGAQGLIFLSPMLSIVFSRKEVEKYTRLLENPKAVDLLLEKLNAG